MKTHQIIVGDNLEKKIPFGNDLPLAIMAGPCVLESREHAFEMSYALKEISEKLNIPLIYKTSFDKANRTSDSSPRGVGIDKGLEILSEVRSKTGLPIVTDVHTADQCKPVSEVADILQIPAFLCRQTDLLVAAAKTGKPLHVKKGQFLAPWDMKNVIKKIEGTGNKNILVCERGVSFGYNTLVNDMRSLPILKEMGYPVVFDATHSVQQPGGAGNKTAGERKYVSILAKAAVSVGIAGVFLETHQDPDNAPSDGPNMVHLKDLPNLLAVLMQFDQLAKSPPAMAANT
jgi:2-dehydro-3-deoxyphosphooctonate aldolase (KDO 8-P synthase)